MIDEAVYQLSKIKLNKISDYYTKDEIKELTSSQNSGEFQANFGRIFMCK